jgi:hypothetical protein
VKRILFMAVSVAVLAFVLLYTGDYLSLRYRIPHHREQFGSVRVQRYFAVPMKNRTTEYMFQPPVFERCVNSLFPHFGESPCWYLNRNRRQEIRVGGAVPDF